MSDRRPRRSRARWRRAISVSTTSMGSAVPTVRMSAGPSRLALAATSCTIHPSKCMIQVVEERLATEENGGRSMAETMVVGVDGTADSLAALSSAVTLAEESGASLVVLHVRHDISLAAGSPEAGPHAAM